MKTIEQIRIEVISLYNQLESNTLFFDAYHDVMHDLVYDYLPLLDEIDERNLAEEVLLQCLAIIEAQKILLTVKLS